MQTADEKSSKPTNRNRLIVQALHQDSFIFYALHKKIPNYQLSYFIFQVEWMQENFLQYNYVIIY
ncbi:MAG: hypothetical protein Tsb0015_13440 [Simkaniaceae bacterium]